MEANNSIYAVWIAAITVVGSIITTCLTAAYRKRVEKKRQPKDRIETIFEGYDALIAQMREDLDRKGALIDNLQRVVDAQAETLKSQSGQITYSLRLIEELREELEKSAEQSKKLQTQLDALRTVV
jgi:predicted RNase H-like nuclease (RuvC/YqgF family)